MIAEQREIVQRFAGHARAFCALVEGCEALAPSVLARKAASVLAQVYEAGLSLPEVSVTSEGVVEDSVSSVLVADISRRVGGKFGRHNLYWTVYEPFEAEEPVAATLGDDLADIYRDLKDGLVTFEGGSERNVLEAVWHWRFGFETHWGRHAVEALRTLHNNISNSLLDERAGPGR